ncbi:hypothetical protein J1614_009825, partial [Plenodomus biglobosus]
PSARTLPTRPHRKHQEAVIKVKYQVHGTNKSTFFFWSYRADCEKQLARCSRNHKKLSGRANEAYNKAREKVEHAESLFSLATEPGFDLHEDTKSEITALRRLQQHKCAHAPHLLDIASVEATEEVDEQAMPGGYAVFMLMTKVPGEVLTQQAFWNMEEDMREQIRRAFKMAMTDLWKCGIMPRDRNLNNLVWDCEERKCYIVDFEDYDEVKKGATWTDDYYRISLDTVPLPHREHPTKMYALTLAGIPISIGANEAVHQQRLLDEEAEAEERQQEFHLDVFCSAQSKKKDEVHNAIVVLKDGKIRLWPKNTKTQLPAPDPTGNPTPHPFTGFYLPFPIQDLPHRPIPASPILGLVTTVPPTNTSASCPASSTPASAPRAKPKLNWVYVDTRTRELKYGCRAEAKQHMVGPWDWTEDELGVTLEGEECLVAVEEERGGYGWAVYWDGDDDGLKGVGVGGAKRVLRCSIERRIVEEKNDRVTGLDEEDTV